MKFLKNNCLWLSALIVFLAAAACIIRVEILGYVLCPFCWYIRIFTFSLTIILIMAAYKKDYNIIPYAMTLAAFGAFFALVLLFKAAGVTEASSCPFNGMCKALAAKKEGISPIFMPTVMLFVFASVFALLFLGRKRND